MFSAMRRLYDWMGSSVYSPYAEPILAFMFYLEAIFFVPTDPMLLVYCIERQDKAFRYATIATVSSVLGGLTGYAIGYVLWQTAGNAIIHSPMVNYVLSPENFTYLCGLYKQYEAWAILAAAFTPIPYKAATLTAGFCSLSLTPFIISSFIGRGARFYLYAVAIYIWGPQIKEYIDRYFNLLVLLAMTLIIGLLWFLKH